ncbi:MAG: metal ABC transporter ATP-binding protein [Lentisphaeraceae bacterium]|nr:metal ABC transporter ATP-binding protein [Lentisphaeraceae bacterium]
MNNHQISISDLSLGYSSKKVISQANLNISEGDFWGLVGPNGQGKSTFIKTLMGLVRPLSGKIKYVGLSRKDIGYVPQRSSVTSTLDMTTTEFIALSAPGLPFSKTRKSTITSVLKSVWLNNKGGRSIKTLSGGERQRLSIARALVRNPKLLILDEPDTGLDFTSIGHLTELLTELNANKKITILLISHNLHTVQRLTSKTVLFAHGQAHSGATSEVLTNEKITAAFTNSQISQDSVLKWLQKEA